jgi:hypothetical protein
VSSSLLRWALRPIALNPELHGTEPDFLRRQKRLTNCVDNQKYDELMMLAPSLTPRSQRMPASPYPKSRRNRFLPSHGPRKGAKTSEKESRTEKVSGTVSPLAGTEKVSGPKRCQEPLPCLLGHSLGRRVDSKSGLRAVRSA